jgi:L-fucose mutarotase/ribose pyranase (RbsD/FucU family)
MLPLLGHRNWIVVADAAYPAQCTPGIETLYTGAEHAEVLQKVLEAIDASGHLCARVSLDAELKFVSEEDAPGVTTMRQELNRLLAGRTTQAMAHEEIIARLDEAGRRFRILLLKSKLTIPYSTVFLELDCGYWSSEAEQRLRTLQAKEAAETQRSR